MLRKQQNWTGTKYNYTDFGSSFSIDDENILIGAPYSNEISLNSGAAYIYNFNAPDLIFYSDFE